MNTPGESEPQSKAWWRAQLVSQRDALPLSDQRRLSRQACEHLLQHPILTRARRVALYAPIRSELDTTHAFDALRRRGICLHLPRSSRSTGTLLFAAANDLAALRPGLYGVREPVGDPVPLDTLDAIIVPGVAFDRRGGRLGYGAGYYDRSLVGYAGPCIGLAYAFQVVERLPIGAHDRLVDAIVTDSGPVQLDADVGGAVLPAGVDSLLK